MNPRFVSVATFIFATTASGCGLVTDVPIGADDNLAKDSAAKDGGSTSDDAGLLDTGVDFDSGATTADAVVLDSGVDFDGGPAADGGESDAVSEFDSGVDFDGGPAADSGIDWDAVPELDSGDFDGGTFDSGDFDGPTADAISPDCADTECGPSPGPSCTCKDGSLGCNTGRCLRNFEGTCGWEYRVCPK